MRLWIVMTVLTSWPAWTQTTIASKTAGMKKFPGFFTFYWDDVQGKIWLEIDRFDQDFIYLNGLSHGLGSNDIGLDRGQIDNNRIVKFVRIGPKILLVQPNPNYRAVSEDVRERRAVEESFAKSVLWGFSVEAEEGKKALVDATAFLLRDAHDVIGRLKQTQQGNYQIDASRCAVYLERTKSFPRNTEFDVILTYTGGPAGAWLRSVTPTSDAVTVHQHHSFVQLPDPGYRPRRHDPRVGMLWMEYNDYATPMAEPLTQRYVLRHRLEKKDPGAAVSEPIRPIVYYVDAGTPEPIRSALLDGARWWTDAFEAIGFKNAFRVELLPDDADPMDVRYNVIQWVHRSTRGWSYGNAVIDPRTGEIIKGHVSLGSLRVRQDYLIATGLLAPFEEGKEIPKSMEAMALARLRQLSAHEVGHTLGFNHNFAASPSNRASVMDYPHPLITIKDGKLNLDDAYATGIGEWDKVTVAYAYSQFNDAESERAGLQDVVKKSLARGLMYLTDTDARPAGTAHAQAHLWDNGTDAADELIRLLNVRRVALEQFSENVIRVGDPMSTIEEALVPIYLLHRYQTDAAAKMIGGLTYSYTLRGDGQPAPAFVPARDQWRALSAVLQTIDAQTLALPERILKLIPPRADGYDLHRELFPRRTGVTMDALSAAESAADHSIGLLLHPQRAARLIDHKRRDTSLPDLGHVIDSIVARTWKNRPTNEFHAEVQRTVNDVVLYHLMSLAVHPDVGGAVQAIAWNRLDELKRWLSSQKTDGAWKYHYDLAVRNIDRLASHPKDFVLSHAPSDPPPGAPIGSCGMD